MFFLLCSYQIRRSYKIYVTLLVIFIIVFVKRDCNKKSHPGVTVLIK